MGALQPWHLIIVVAIFALLYGSKRLPDMARSLGTSMRIFKSEVKEMQSESSETPAAPAKPITSERVDTAAPAPEQSPDHHTA